LVILLTTNLPADVDVLFHGLESFVNPLLAAIQLFNITGEVNCSVQRIVTRDFYLRLNCFRALGDQVSRIFRNQLRSVVHH